MQLLIFLKFYDKMRFLNGQLNRDNYNGLLKTCTISIDLSNMIITSYEMWRYNCLGEITGNIKIMVKITYKIQCFTNLNKWCMKLWCARFACNKLSSIELKMYQQYMDYVYELRAKRSANFKATILGKKCWNTLTAMFELRPSPLPCLLIICYLP